MNNTNITVSNQQLQVLGRRIIRLLKFGTVGLSGVVVNSGLLYIGTDAVKLDYRISAVIAIEFSIINNYLWNTLWTWADKKALEHIFLLKRFLKFQLSAIITAFLINYGILICLTELFHVHYQISNVTGIALGSIMNFLLGHFWIFKNKYLKTVAN